MWILQKQKEENEIIWTILFLYLRLTTVAKQQSYQDICLQH